MPEFSWRPANDATQEERDAALLEQAGCGTPGPTSGLIGYLDGERAGWVAVEPRENCPRIWARQKSWMRMNPDLEGVWSVTCFVVRKGFRRQGLMYDSPPPPSSTEGRSALAFLRATPPSRRRGRP